MNENTEIENQSSKASDILADRSDTAFEFILEKEEVRSALYLVGRLKSRKSRNIVEIVICAILFVIALVNVIFDPNYYIGYIVMAATAIAIVLVLIVPKKDEDRTVADAMKSTNAKTIITPMEDKLRVKVPKSGALWEITNDMVRGVKSNDLVTVILLKDTRFLVVPKRAVDTEKKAAAFEQSKKAITLPDVTDFPDKPKE